MARTPETAAVYRNIAAEHCAEPAARRALARIAAMAGDAEDEPAEVEPPVPQVAYLRAGDGR